MGEAKRRSRAAVPVVYHHTSTLRTNQIWMSGVIQVEGETRALHPQLGEIRTDAFTRRAMRDFPPLGWFTRRIEVPNCLQIEKLHFASKTTGELVAEMDIGSDYGNAIALHRIALGFPIASTPVVPWPDHAGFRTPEGQELNQSAIEYGDDPSDWYVSEVPVDVATATEVWTASSVLRPKLSRNPTYLREVHRMVRLCRETPGVFIPPAWATEDQIRQVAASIGVPVG